MLSEVVDALRLTRGCSRGESDSQPPASAQFRELEAENLGIAIGSGGCHVSLVVALLVGPRRVRLVDAAGGSVLGGRR